MKIHTLIITALGLAALGVPCDASASVAMLSDSTSTVKTLTVERSDNILFVSMQLDCTRLKIKSNREVSYIPVLTYGDSIYQLPKVVLAGRNRYIQHQRHSDLPADAHVYRPGQVIDYMEVIPYRPWMETATLSVSEDVCGCGFNILSSDKSDLAVLDFKEREFAPQFAFITPVVEETKTRNESGSAYIDFPVNRTEIRPDYRRNPEELQKIRNTIDVLRNDDDISIQAVSFVGYASPEGGYANNERLARGRTEALASYVRGLYSFPQDIIKSGWVAEDWAGLKKYVETSDIENREGILDIIDMTGLDPDKREQRLRTDYPAQYRFLLENVYPGLRHSDYAVQYQIRTYADVEEIRRLIKTAPQKLSLHEMFVLAQNLEPASDEYREVFEVAVRMYPDNPVANLNAANIALRRNELDRAEAYLAKAGNPTEAQYARGVLTAKRAIEQGSTDFTDAIDLLREAEKAGCTQAADAIAQLEEVQRYARGKVKITK